ncbi:SHS2 domain [Trypanosoma vivax]|nr:putative DNA-directed RNA polymerase III subunit,putative [Trypanosoma vivax]KAH8604994.1 SHS2 domain [Trypanosoma vivax]
MAVFYSYIMRDIVELEPVYFPYRVVAAPPSLAADVCTRDNAEVDQRDDLDEQCYQVTLEDTLMHRLTERYVGKIVPSLGLCVAIHDILHSTQGTVRGTSASAWFTVQFRICVFAPAPGARLRATIAAQNHRGIFLSLDFFQFLFLVPGDKLIAPSTFDEKRGCWVLQVDDGSDESAVNAYERGDEVVVRVERVVVREPMDFHGDVGTRGVKLGVCGGTEEAPRWPMEVFGSFVGTGLGPVLWFER